MADNTVLNAGAGGDTIATDDVAGVKYQQVKLVDGAADSTARIGGDATNGLDVDVTRVQGNVAVTHAGLTALNGAISGTEVQVDVLTLPAVDTELTTADLDTGAGTDTRAVVGLVGSASGGGALIPGSATDGLLVNLGTNNDVTVTGSVTANAGTNLNTSALAVETGGNLAGAATSLAIMDDWDNAASDGASVSGDTAHDAADAGEPVKLGHKAIDLGANPTDVAANDRTNWYAMRNGVPFVIGGAPFVKSQNLQVTDADGAQTDTAILTAAANVAIMVTAIEVTCDNANTVDVSVRIGFGTVNTPAADADKVILFHPGIAAGSGVVKGSGAGIIGAGLSGEDLRITSEDPVTGSFSVVVTYFTLAIG